MNENIESLRSKVYDYVIKNKLFVDFVGKDDVRNAVDSIPEEDFEAKECSRHIEIGEEEITGMSIPDVIDRLSHYMDYTLLSIYGESECTYLTLVKKDIEDEDEVIKRLGKYVEENLGMIAKIKKRKMDLKNAIGKLQAELEILENVESAK